ncbi:MAG: signal peptidase I [Bacteroidota bacterium]
MLRVCGLLVLVFVQFSCEPRVFNVPTPSMERTIKIGTKVFLGFGEVSRNDIVVFKVPSDLSTYFIFRMVAQPGDSIRIQELE